MEKMKYSDLVTNVSKATEISSAEADKVIKAVFGEITAQMSKGMAVGIPGFGTFEAKARAAHMAMNPRTKTQMEVPACKAPAFKASSKLKTTLNP